MKTLLHDELQIMLFGKLTSYVGCNIQQRRKNIKVNHVEYELDQANELTTSLSFSAYVLPNYDGVSQPFE